MDPRIARLTERHIARAIASVREAIGQLCTTPDSLIEHDLADVGNDLENTIARLEALRAECKVYAQETSL